MGYKNFDDEYEPPMTAIDWKARAEAAEAELAALKDAVKSVNNITTIQCSNGNWNFDPYMHGMANALLLAQSILTDNEYAPLEAPGQWLSDIPRELSGIPLHE